MEHLKLYTVMGVALTASACALLPTVIENVHTVVPGTVYRSAQLSSERLGELIAQRHIRTVLNLRGPSPNEPWYRDERAATARAGAEHRDFELSSTREVPPAQADQLLQLMREAPKPLLIHCWGGADRTGLASALYLYAIEGQPPPEAAAALSIRYHHLWFTSASAMDRSFQRFVAARAAPQAASR